MRRRLPSIAAESSRSGLWPTLPGVPQSSVCAPSQARPPRIPSGVLPDLAQGHPPVESWSDSSPRPLPQGRTCGGGGGGGPPGRRHRPRGSAPDPGRGNAAKAQAWRLQASERAAWGFLRTVPLSSVSALSCPPAADFRPAAVLPLSLQTHSIAGPVFQQPPLCALPLPLHPGTPVPLSPAFSPFAEI